MNPMIKCMKLDYMLLKPYFKSLLLVLAAPLVFPVFSGSRSLFEGLSFAATILAMTTVYTFAIAEKNNLERFYGFLPVGRSSMVAGRYLAIYIMSFFFILLETAAQVLLLVLVKSTVPKPAEVLGSMLTCILLFCVYTGVQLPGYYKYGSIKGKMLMFIPTAGSLVFFYVIGMLGIRMDTVPAVFQNPAILVTGAFLLIFAVTVGSASVSMKIVAKG